MKKHISLVLVMALIVSVLAGTAVPASAAGFSDMPAEGYWSYAALSSAVDSGLLTGYEDGTVRPDANITRAEAAAVINRAFGAAEEASVTFSDVTDGKWYGPDVRRAVQMKTFGGVGGNRFAGDDDITREQVFTVIARAMGLTGGSSDGLKAFSDASEVSSWAAGAIAAMAGAGYISGDGGELRPGDKITREEFAQVMKNVIGQYITEPGTYSTVKAGNVLVRSGGVTLKNLTVNGDLIIGDGVGTGDVTIDGVTVTGRIVLRGAGANSFRVIGKSSASSVTIAKATTGGVHIDVSDEADVEVIYVDDGSDEVIVEGKIGTVSVASEGAAVSLRNAEVTSVNVAAANTSLTVESGTVASVVVSSGASAAAITVAGTSAAASIGTIATAAANTAITVGSGTVATIVAQNISSGTTVSTGAQASVGVVAVASAADVVITNSASGAVGTVLTEAGAAVTAVTATGEADTSAKTVTGTISEDASAGTVTIISDDGSVKVTLDTSGSGSDSGSVPTGTGGTGGGTGGDTGGTTAKYSGITGVAFSGGNVVVTVGNGTSTTTYNAFAAVQNGSNYLALLENGYILCQYDAAGPFGANDTVYINYDGHAGSVTRPSYISGTELEGKYDTAYSQRNVILGNTNTLVLNCGAVGSVTYGVNPASDTVFIKADGFAFLAPTSQNPEAVMRNILVSLLILDPSASPSGTIKTIYTSDVNIRGEVDSEMLRYIAENLVEPFAESVRDGNALANISGLTVYKTWGGNATVFQYGDNKLTLAHDLTISLTNDPSAKTVTLGIG